MRSLQWSEVRPKHIVILAAKAKDREERVIPLSPTLAKILDRRKKGPDGEKLPTTAYVFGNEVGEQIDRKKANDLWRATCKAAKITDLRFHDLRREFGSQLIESGVPLHVTRDALGHSNVSMTSVYLASSLQGLDKAYAKLDSVRRRKRLKVV